MISLKISEHENMLGRFEVKELPRAQLSYFVLLILLSASQICKLWAFIIYVQRFGGSLLPYKMPC